MGVLTPWRHSCLPPIKEAICCLYMCKPTLHRETSTCNTIEASQDDQEWTNNITVSRTCTLPEDPKQAHKIRVQAARFTLIGGHLYKRSFTGPYLRCLSHLEALPLALRTMGHGHSRTPPTAPAQKKFLLVATDYFSKWVEAEAYASIKDKDVTKFVWKNIICRFGIPQTIVADNVMGGEATNKTLIIALKKRLEQAKGKWVEELPGVLWAYRTTPGRPTGNTPFALAYGMDAVIPTEIGLPTIRTEAAKQDDTDAELGRNLDWADEVRETASIRMTDYQQRASAHYNRKVRPRSFKNAPPFRTNSPSTLLLPINALQIFSRFFSMDTSVRSCLTSPQKSHLILRLMRRASTDSSGSLPRLASPRASLSPSGG
ncbi:hypothetical protein AAG906_003456 [Vitis piasezkii]